MKKNFSLFKEQTGIVLITASLILTVLLIIGSYLVAFTSLEHKIASSQLIATKNYYLSETGVKEMIWKIKNEETIKNAFLAGTLTETNDISRTNVFNDPNAAYTIRAISTALSEADLTTTSTYQIGGYQSQRVVKVYVVRATNSDPNWKYNVFAGGRGSQQNGNFRFSGSGVILTANGGRLHANQEFKVQGGELIVNDGAVTSANVINIVAGATLTLNNSYQDAPTTSVDMLQIDFDSDLPTSWKNRATATYTENQFKNLPNNTVLEGIIYVTGDAKIIGKNFTINGVLVAEEDIEITLAGQTLTVNYNPTYGAGLLAKDDVEITTTGGTVTIDGLIYAADNLEITSAGTDFTINGSMTGFDASVTASGGSIILNYTLENFEQVIDPVYNGEAPIIQISHWEEEY